MKFIITIAFCILATSLGAVLALSFVLSSQSDVDKVSCTVGLSDSAACAIQTYHSNHAK